MLLWKGQIMQQIALHKMRVWGVDPVYTMDSKSNPAT
jgi:hypothetical protein